MSKKRDFCLSQNGGQTTDSANEKGNYRFVRITDIDEDGKLKNNDKVYVNIKSNDATNYILATADLLLVRTGATFGKVLYFDSEEQSIFASYLIRLKLISENILPKFLWYFAFSKTYWKQANELVGGGTQPQFNANKIIDIKIPLPPLSTQHQIVEKLDRQMQALDGVRLLKSEAQKRIEGILSSVWGDGKPFLEECFTPAILCDKRRKF